MEESLERDPILNFKKEQGNSAERSVVLTNGSITVGQTYAKRKKTTNKFQSLLFTRFKNNKQPYMHYRLRCKI